MTGGAGFVGSRLCARLVREGYLVISLDNYFTGSKENHVEGVEYREGHTKDIALHVPEKLDLIYHLGEYSRVEQSLQEPDLVWDLNAAGTFAVLEFWRARNLSSNVCKLVYAGSSTKFSDGGLGRNLSPYTWTKATNTELVKNYGAWYDLPYAITYFYSVYGPGEIPFGPYSTLISIFKQEAKNGHPLSVVSPGTQVRNFTHVDDTIEALVLVGAYGEGDEYGISAQESYSILEVAKMFLAGQVGKDIIMLPERAGNRMTGTADTSKIRALGWRQEHRLDEYIREFTESLADVKKTEPRVIVFTTTFHPIAGPAEIALVELMRRMPEVHFDVVTTLFSTDAQSQVSPLSNVQVHRIGHGRPLDKFLLPILGFKKARELSSKHTYLFAWSVMASYGTIAAIRLKRATNIPLLVSLADQRFDRIPFYYRALVKLVLGNADQISTTTAQAGTVTGAMPRVASNRRGDPFANQIRFIYNSILEKSQENHE